MKSSKFYLIISLFFFFLYSCEQDTSPDLTLEKSLTIKTTSKDNFDLEQRLPSTMLVVKNIGNEESAPCKTMIEYPFAKVQPIELATPSIGPGGTYRHYFTLPSIPADNHQYFVVTVDYRDEVFESDESNNKDVLSMEE